METANFVFYRYMKRNATSKYDDIATTLKPIIVHPDIELEKNELNKRDFIYFKLDGTICGKEITEAVQVLKESGYIEGARVYIPFQLLFYYESKETLTIDMLKDRDVTDELSFKEYFEAANMFTYAASYIITNDKDSVLHTIVKVWNERKLEKKTNIESLIDMTFAFDGFFGRYILESVYAMCGYTLLERILMVSQLKLPFEKLRDHIICTTRAHYQYYRKIEYDKLHNLRPSTNIESFRLPLLQIYYRNVKKPVVHVKTGIDTIGTPTEKLTLPVLTDLTYTPRRVQIGNIPIIKRRTYNDIANGKIIETVINLLGYENFKQDELADPGENEQVLKLLFLSFYNSSRSDTFDQDTIQEVIEFAEENNASP